MVEGGDEGSESIVVDPELRELLGSLVPRCVVLDQAFARLHPRELGDQIGRVVDVRLAFGEVR